MLLQKGVDAFPSGGGSEGTRGIETVLILVLLPPMLVVEVKWLVKNVCDEAGTELRDSSSEGIEIDGPVVVSTVFVPVLRGRISIVAGSGLVTEVS